jgi:hypothetical protein
VLDGPTWRARAAAHAAAVDELTRDHRARASVHAAHPVADFLFTYYSLRPAQLARWHPGIGVGLCGAGERADDRFYVAVDGVVWVDGPTLLRDRARMIDFLDRLLAHTADAVPQFGCFGLHEWAMVYGQTPEQVRHAAWPLRLGADGTDEVVRTHSMRCTHYDAYRFFTPAARPLNRLTPDVESRDRLEQPGCLHATMDLYKWAYKLGPAVPGELLLDCFRLARDVRELDMRASPYDLTALGYSPVAIETAEGKAEYVAAQRGFAERGGPLRRRLRDVVATLRAARPVADGSGGHR